MYLWCVYLRNRSSLYNPIKEKKQAYFLFRSLFLVLWSCVWSEKELDDCWKFWIAHYFKRVMFLNCWVECVFRQKCQMTVGLGIGSPQNLPVNCRPEMYADLCKCYVHTALSRRNVDQIVIPFTRNEHNRRPAVQNLNTRTRLIS